VSTAQIFPIGALIDISFNNVVIFILLFYLQKTSIQEAECFIDCKRQVILGFSPVRSHCPINYWLELLGDKWSLLVLRDVMFKDRHTFKEFMAGGEAIASNILTDRLKRLEKMGILRRESGASHKDVRYTATEKGADLIPMLVEIICWSYKYDTSTAAEKDFIKKAEKDRKKLLQDLRRNVLEDAL